MPDTTLTVNLRDNERLVFVDIPVGASYEVTEKNVDSKYLASYEFWHNSTTPYPVVNASGAGLPLTLKKDSSMSPVPLYIGESTNKVIYTNSTLNSVPGGISVNDLPYVVIIALTLVSLGAFILLIYRKNMKRITDK